MLDTYFVCDPGQAPSQTGQSERSNTCSKMQHLKMECPGLPRSQLRYRKKTFKNDRIEDVKRFAVPHVCPLLAHVRNRKPFPQRGPHARGVGQSSRLPTR